MSSKNKKSVKDKVTNKDDKQMDVDQEVQTFIEDRETLYEAVLSSERLKDFNSKITKRRTALEQKRFLELLEDFVTCVIATLNVPDDKKESKDKIRWVEEGPKKFKLFDALNPLFRSITDYDNREESYAALIAKVDVIIPMLNKKLADLPEKVVEEHFEFGKLTILSTTILGTGFDIDTYMKDKIEFVSSGELTKLGLKNIEDHVKNLKPSEYATNFLFYNGGFTIDFFLNLQFMIGAKWVIDRVKSPDFVHVDDLLNPDNEMVAINKKKLSFIYKREMYTLMKGDDAINVDDILKKKYDDAKNQVSIEPDEEIFRIAKENSGVKEEPIDLTGQLKLLLATT